MFPFIPTWKKSFINPRRKKNKSKNNVDDPIVWQIVPFLLKTSILFLFFSYSPVLFSLIFALFFEYSILFFFLFENSFHRLFQSTNRLWFEIYKTNSFFFFSISSIFFLRQIACHRQIYSLNKLNHEIEEQKDNMNGKPKERKKNNEE